MGASRTVGMLTLVERAGLDGEPVWEPSRADQKLLAGIGQRVRSARFHAGLRTSELAHRAGLEVVVIEAIEEGTTNAHVSELAAIAAVLGRDILGLVSDV